MFDNYVPEGATYGGVKKAPPDGGSYAQPVMDGKPASKLDTQDMRELHGRLISFYQVELDIQAENRMEQAGDEDFYDNIQWTAEDMRTLKDRGQVPLVYNVIATTINWVTGTEKRARSDYKVLPRRKDGAKPAERKTQLLKYLSDVNDSPFHNSRAFEDSVKVGVGWIECGVQDETEGEPVYTRYESWRNILWDSASTNMDLSDCRYVFRSKWVDLDIAQEMFPDKTAELYRASMEADRYRLGDLANGDDAMDAIENALDSGGSLGIEAYGYRRRRVRLIEAWFRKPVLKQVMKGGDFRGDVYDEASPGHTDQVQGGYATVIEKTIYRMHCAVMTASDLLVVSETPFRHNSYPFTPIWCYRRGRDGMPYGMIRGLKMIQVDINKRASKSLHIISTNKVLMEEGAVEDIDKFTEEAARPDAVLVYKKGYKLDLNVERGMDASHLEYMSRSIQMVQQQSGVTDEAMGRTTNAVAGIAIQRRQEQAGMATSNIFDHLRYAKKHHGEKELSLVEQYFSETKAFRITSMRGTPQYIEINDGLPDNDIVRTKADVVVDEVNFNATIRAAQTAELFDLLQKIAPVAPQIVIVMLDLLIETMDIPARDEIVARIRKATGMSDPEETAPTPEQIAAQAQAQKQQQMAEADAMATIADKQAGAQLKIAQAQKAQVDGKKMLALMAGDNVNAQKAAIEAALALLTAPPAAPVADAILQESGFVSKSQSDAQARDQAMQQAIQEAQAHVQQQQQDAQQQAAAQQAGAVQQIKGATADLPPIEKQAAQQQLAQQATGGPPNGAAGPPQAPPGGPQQ